MQLTNVTLIIHEYLFQERTRALMQLNKKVNSLVPNLHYWVPVPYRQNSFKT
jgi:hypothetical protein